MSIWLRLLVTLLLASELTSCGSSAVPVTLERTTAPGIHQKVAEHKGREAVLVNFWATWCAPCVEEFSIIADLKLRDVGGKEVCLSDVADPGGLVVIFSCNTCPWVIAWEDLVLCPINSLTFSRSQPRTTGPATAGNRSEEALG